MKTNKLSTRLLSVLFFCTITSAIQGQIMLREVPLKRQIENSSLVIEGKVVLKRSFWDAENKNIYTVNTVEIYKVFKGKPLSLKIDVITPGGAVDNIIQMVMPSLKLLTGDLGVFTLYDNDINMPNKSKSESKQYKVYSSLQGFYKYNLKEDLVINPFNSKKGISKGFYEELMSITNSNYAEVIKYNINEIQSKLNQNKAFLPPASITFLPTSSTAGTKSVLTISGSGFGTTQGKVGFRDADSGGNDGPPNFNPVYIDALDSQVLTWTNTEITVEIPSGAGTGDIRITNNDSSEGFSNQTLTISYALINTNDGFGTQHFSADGTGSITWRMNTSFNANTAAKESFLRAFETWRCETGINWIIGANTSVNQSAIDGISLISFDNASSPLPEGTLGQCSYVISSCNPRTVRDLVGELDIIFDDDINDPDTPAIESWYFGNDPNGIDFTQWDFQSVALHELGHGHQLGHVINTNNVMHFSISNFEVQRVLSTDDINAAGIIQNFSTTTGLCGTTQMTNYSGDCNLGLEEDELEHTIAIFPNPARNQFSIKNNSITNLEKAVVYDLSGRLIFEHKISNTSRTEVINVQGLSAGIYIIKIHTENNQISTKLVID